MFVFFRIDSLLFIILSLTEIKAVSATMAVDSFDHHVRKSKVFQIFLDELCEYFQKVKDKTLIALHETIEGFSSSKNNATNLKIPEQTNKEIYGGLFDRMNLPLACLYGLQVGAGLNLICSGFSCMNIGAVVLSLFIFFPFEPHLEKDKFTPAIFDKAIIRNIWKYWPFLKEENIVLPPPEDSRLEKLFKQLFPGIDVKNTYFILIISRIKDMLKSIMEITGSPLSITITALSCSTATAFLAVVLYDRFLTDTEDSPEEEAEFTDEDLLEEYDDDPELQVLVKEFLTPIRHYKADF